MPWAIYSFICFWWLFRNISNMGVVSRILWWCILRKWKFNKRYPKRNINLFCSSRRNLRKFELCFRNNQRGSWNCRPYFYYRVRNNICPGSTIALNVNGAALPTDYSYVWYTDACGAVPVGVGTSIDVTPTLSTTYFVAAIGTCGLYGMC